MPTASEFLNDRPKSSFLILGNFGEGKTSISITFPKIYYIGFRPGGLEVIRQDKNKEYQKNLVHYEEFCASNDEEMRSFFQPGIGKIYKAVDQAKDMAKKGEVETLVIDDTTDGVEAFQNYVWKFETKKTERGLDDNQSMFGLLKTRVSDFFKQYVLTFRRYGNVVVNAHLMRESEQVIEGTKTRAGVVDKRSEIYPDIVGSFRREIQRDFENVIYVESKIVPGKQREFVGYTEKCSAFGTVILAKNALGLENPIKDISYKTLFNNK